MDESHINKGEPKKPDMKKDIHMIPFIRIDKLIHGTRSQFMVTLAGAVGGGGGGNDSFPGRG